MGGIGGEGAVSQFNFSNKNKVEKNGNIFVILKLFHILSKALFDQIVRDQSHKLRGGGEHLTTPGTFFVVG